MSCFVFPSLLFYWMLDFALAPMLPLVSLQEIFIRMPFRRISSLCWQAFWMYNQDKSTRLMADLTWQRALNPKWSGTFPKTA
jgi:hypothetical protein